MGTGMTPAMESELNRLGVVIRAKPKAKPASGPIAVVRNNEPEF